jgi:hypothetical protein
MKFTSDFRFGSLLKDHAASTDLFRKRLTGLKPMFSPARVIKYLKYPRENADDPAVPDWHSVIC